MAERVSTKQWGWMDADELAERERMIADETIVFAGQGRNRDLVHVISGSSKFAKQPLARCGLWVSNKYRMIREDERVCSKCVRGGATFTRYNQPRDCQDCGRKFSDSTRRDNNESICADCYEKAGRVNAHMDGHHAADADGFQEECPSCQEDQHLATGEIGSATLADREEEMISVKVLSDQDLLQQNHENGAHDQKLIDGCPSCIEHAKLMTAQDTLEATQPQTFEQQFAERQVRRTEQRIKDRIAHIARRLRQAADDLERNGTRITEIVPDPIMSEVEQASIVVNQISWLFPNLSVHELIEMAAALADARRELKAAQ